MLTSKLSKRWVLLRLPLYLFCSCSRKVNETASWCLCLNFQSNYKKGHQVHSHSFVLPGVRKPLFIPLECFYWSCCGMTSYMEHSMSAKIAHIYVILQHFYKRVLMGFHYKNKKKKQKRFNGFWFFWAIYT